LFAADVASLQAAGKRSADNVDGMLADAADSIGSSRPAGEVPRAISCPICRRSTIEGPRFVPLWFARI
jgi:hypothetical protein